MLSFDYRRGEKMETINDRVKVLRKELGLTLEKFGQHLGVGKTAINKIEKGENNVTEQMTKAICREFNVDYFWLTEGIGNEMFIKKETDPIKLVAKEHGLTDLEAEIVVEFMKLTAEERAMMVNIIGKLFKNK